MPRWYNSETKSDHDWVWAPNFNKPVDLIGGKISEELFSPQKNLRKTPFCDQKSSELSLNTSNLPKDEINLAKFYCVRSSLRGCSKLETFFLRFLSLSSGQWGKIKLKLTTLTRIFIHVVCRFNSIAFATQPQLACPSDPTIAITRAVPIDGPRYYPGSASYRCIRMREYVDPA